MRKYAVRAKRVIDSPVPGCNNISNAGESATKQQGQEPDPSYCQQVDSHGSPESESNVMLTDSKIIEPHKVHWLWKETVNRLRVLQGRAREGKCVDEASEFARWVRMSGLAHIYETFTSPAPLEVSWPTVEKLIVDILWDCEAYYKNAPQGPWVQKSELEAINHKLDLIAGRIARLSAANNDTAEAGVAPAATPALRVLQAAG